MRDKGYARAIGGLAVLSMTLSAVIVTATDGPIWKTGKVFRARNAPEAVAALLRTAGLPTDRSSEGPADVLAPGAAKAIAGTGDGKFTLKGVAFKKPIELKDLDSGKKWKAKAAPLEPDARTGTAKGSLFPDFEVSGVKKGGVPAVKKEVLGRTKFTPIDPVLDGGQGDARKIKGRSLKKSKATKSPSKGSFALAGKIGTKDGRAVGKIAAPALQYREWASRIQSKKQDGRSGKVKKKVPGSWTNVGEGTAPEGHLAGTKLGSFKLKTTLRRGVPVDFRISKKPALESADLESGD